MRHVRGIGLAVALAAAVYFAAGWGYWRLLRSYLGKVGAPALPADGGLLHDSRLLFPFAAIAATALLAGILVAAPRISPLAAGLPGLALLAWTGVYAGNVHRGLSDVPLTVDGFGAGFAVLLQNGLLGAAGLVLVVPLFVPSRWRRPSAVRGGRAAPAEEPSAGLGLLADDWTDTAPYPETSGDSYRA
jgi:hypothetical protein